MVFVKRPRPGLVLLTHGKHVQWESQLRNPMEEDDIGVALTEGLYNAIAKELNVSSDQSIYPLQPTDSHMLTNGW